MIGRLRGRLIEKQPPHLMVDVNGVGYDLQAPMTTFYRLPELDAEVVLHTHFAVSETSQQLYGFADPRDRTLFRTLIKVNGVGPKMAVAIMSGMESSDIARSVREDDTAALVKVPGVGRKTAERLIVELRDKLADWDAVALPLGELEAASSASLVAAAADLQADAESALVSLGYKPAQATKVIEKILQQHTVTRSEELIRLALRAMLPG